MMKKFLLCFILLALCPLLLIAQAPDTLWTKTYGGEGDDRGSSVQQTDDGGYIIAGYTNSFGVGDDVYLVKTDSIGDTLWTKRYDMGGADGYDRGQAVRQTTDGGYVIAAYYYWFPLTWGEEVWLIKTDSSGISQWTRTYGGDGQDRAYSVQQTDDGGYIVAGYYSYDQNKDIWLLKTDTLLDTLWTRTYGGDGQDRAYSVQQTDDGGYIIAGYTDLFGVGYDVYLVKTDSIGDTLWTRTYGGDGPDGAHSVHQTDDGGYIIAGYTDSFGSGYDVYLVKTDSIGDTLWTKTCGGSEYDVAFSAQQTQDLGYVIVGSTTSFGAGQGDVYLIKVDSLGNILWDTTYGGTGEDRGGFVQQTLDEGYIITGVTQSFGAGERDVYLIKTTPDTVGVEERKATSIWKSNFGATIFNGPLQLPEGKKCKVFDITGRVVEPDKIQPGIYFLEIDKKIIQKVIKVK